MRFCRALFVLAAASLPLSASTTSLNFEGLVDSETIAGFYNGGLGGLGSGPGANYGITFSSDATAYIQTNQSAGGITDTGLFGGEPTVYTAMLFCSICATDQTSQTINVASGFDSAFSLYYSAPFSADQPGQLVIWSGLDGTGVQLGLLDIPGTETDPACDNYGEASDPGVPACPFFQLSTTFSGIAKSVVFSGASDVMYFDDITLGAPVPEPAAWFLVVSGMVGIASLRRSRKFPNPSGV